MKSRRPYATCRSKMRTQNKARAGRGRFASWTAFAAASSAALLAALFSLAATPHACRVPGAPEIGGWGPPPSVGASCTDPDYNEQTLVIGSTEQTTLDL